MTPENVDDVADEPCPSVSPQNHIPCWKPKGHGGPHYGETTNLTAVWGWPAEQYDGEVSDAS